jgi:hypothetical protein
MLIQKSSGNLLHLIIVALFLTACAPTIIRYYPRVIEKSLTKKIQIIEVNLNESSSKETYLDLMKYKVQYAYGYLLERADRVYDDDYSEAIILQDNAKLIFKEAIEIGLNQLNTRYSSFNQWLASEKGDQISFTQKDTPYLYWLAAAYGGAIKSSRANPKWVIHLPKVGRLLEKAIEIEPNWNYGSLYSAMISFTVSRPDPSINLRKTAQKYFDLALKASDGEDASPYLAFAENISIKEQNKTEFLHLTNTVLTMDIGQNPELTLGNIIAQERARWLQSKLEDLFYE